MIAIGYIYRARHMVMEFRKETILLRVNVTLELLFLQILTTMLDLAIERQRKFLNLME